MYTHLAYFIVEFGSVITKSQFVENFISKIDIKWLLNLTSQQII